MDDAPSNPRHDDRSQQTLDTRAPRATPEISLPTEPNPPVDSSAFVPGDLIAKRFRIERFLARGGMGEVYEALDIELKQKVALKTVRSVLLADVQSLERFRQEIVVAKRVTHPNVCRTYDLFRHESTKPGESDVLVVSMELLSGQTLSQFLRQKGRLSPEEALPLVHQMIAGLSAAHQAGVVHRDFKSNNVLLVPPPSGAGPVRVVITDFGLAHSLDPGEFALTRTGEMLGTPAYMAPEQVTGKAITPATDIYALGVVIFEMLTGRLPFDGQNWRELAFKRVEETPPSPKSIVPNLDDRWNRAVLKCLEREPADRFQTVEDAERAIAGEAPTQLRHETDQRRRRTRLLFALLGLLVVAAIGVVIGIRFPNLYSWGEPRSVTVLGFKNISGDRGFDTWGEQFRNNLGTTLDVKPIRYVTPRDMGGFWKPQAPSEMPEEPSPDFLTKLHDHGCRYAVYGSYTVVNAPGGHKILWNIHVVDTKTGQSLGSVTRNPTESELTDVVPGAGEEVREKLGVSLSAADKRRTDRALPANAQASQAYAAGKSALENFDYARARDEFLTAVQADPGNAEIRSALAQAWWELGFESKGQEEAKRAADQAADLTDEARGLIQARSFEYHGQWDQAAKRYESLWNLSDNNYQFALLLASSRIGGKQYQQAVDTLANLSGDNIPAVVKAQRDLLLTDAQQKLGNNPDRLKAADSALDIAKSLGPSLLLARAEIAKCQAMFDLGKVADASQICANAVDLNKQLGDDLGTARSQNDVANLYYNHGDLDRAEPLYQQALTIATRIGDMRDQAGALLNLGNIQRMHGNFADAQKLYEHSIQISQERTGINDDLLGAKQGLALCLAGTGHLLEAIPILQNVAAEARPIGDKSNLSGALLNLCVFLPVAGDVRAAKSDCEESLQLMTDTGDKAGQARAQQSLGDVLAASDDLSSAETHYQAALTAQRQLGADSDVAYSEASLADLYTNKRDFLAVEKYAQPALQSFLSQKDPMGEVLVRCTLAQAYLDVKRRQDAQEQIEKARQHLPELQDPAIRNTFLIQQAVVQNSPRPVDSAVAQLKKIESELTASGQVQLAMQAKLARLETLSGAARKSELNSFADEARQRGYLLLARKATEAAAART
jgi:eukaryotic-like serine/threonine-protein kinase